MPAACSHISTAHDNCCGGRCAHKGTVADAHMQFVFISEDLPDGAPKDGAGEKWDVDKSVFGPRMSETDSREVYDTHEVHTRMFLRDWKRLETKQRIQQLIQRGCRSAAKRNGLNVDETVTDVFVEDETEFIKQIFAAHYGRILIVHQYYSLVGAGSLANNKTVMDFSAWGTFCEETQIADPASKCCKRDDLHRIFISCNDERGLTKKDTDVNEDRALLRFEFVDALVRVAVNKYVEDSEAPLGATAPQLSITAALDRLFTDHILPPTNPFEGHDPNVWRKERMYNNRVDEVIQRCARCTSNVFVNIYNIFSSLYDMDMFIILYICIT